MNAPRSRAAAQQTQPTNLAPVIMAVGFAAALVGTFFQLPGALIAALGVSIAAFFYHPPVNPNPKEAPDAKVQQQMRRWDDLKWRAIIPNSTWLLNDPRDFEKFGERAKFFGKLLGGGLVTRVLGYVAQGIAYLLWFVTPGRFVQIAAIGVGLLALTLPANLGTFAEFLPAELVAYDLTWLNAILGYGVVVGIDAAIRKSSAPVDESPGVGLDDMLRQLTAKPTGDDDTTRGSAWRALVGFTLLGAAAGLALLLIVGSAGVSWWFSAPWLAGLALNLIVTSVCLHGTFRNAGLAEWRDLVQTRASWVPRWEALKYPEVQLIDHARVGPFVVDTFASPPSLGSSKAIGLYDSLLPYIAGGGETTAAMLASPALDSESKPVAGSAHPTHFRVVVAPGETEVATADPNVDVEQVKLAAEIGAFIGAREMRLPTPILMDVSPAHTPDSPAAVWETVWSTPLSSPAVVAAVLGLDPDDDCFTEGRNAYFGDFEHAKLADETMPKRMEQAAYTERWDVRWNDALKMGEKKPFLQYKAIKKEKLTPDIEVFWEPFLVSQGLTPAQFFTKDMTKRLANTLKAAPFTTVVGITGALTNGMGPGVRHPQGFAVVHSDSPIPANPASIVPPGMRTREVARWVLGGLINRAFEDAKLPYPEVIEATPLTTARSPQHIWRIHLRLYDGVTVPQIKLNAAKIQQGLGGVRWMRVEASEHGAYMVVGAMPQTEGLKFARQEYKAYCDELDWRHAFDVAGIRALTDGRTPEMLSNEPHESNEKITRMVFSMPSGMSFGKVIEATDKLSAETGNAYVDIRQTENPSTFEVLAAEIDPIPFPAFPDWDYMADADGKKRTRLPFAQTTDGSIVSFDWSLDPHLNVLGSSGGGKQGCLKTPVPTPISSRFPTGWATIGTLREGDLIYGQDGKTYPIIGFTPTVAEDAYVVTFDDGQSTTVGAHHAWRVFDAADRAKQAPAQANKRQRAREERLAEADRLDALAATVQSGTVGTGAQIAEFAGVAYDELQRAGILTHAIARQGLKKTKKEIAVYAMDDILPYLYNVIETRGELRFGGKVLKKYDLDYLELEGAWLSIRNIADALLGRPAERSERDLAKNYVRRTNPRSRTGHERTLINFYPTDETIRLLARYHRTIGENRHMEPAERVVHTEDMLAAGLVNARGARRYAVELAKPIAPIETVVPVAPYTLGAWLGDGLSDNGAIVSMDPEIIAEVTASGYAVRRVDEIKNNQADIYHFERLWNDLDEALDRDTSVNRRKLDKRIPAIYQRASIEQRLALLQGLMDTDGYIAADGGCELTLCKEDLAHDALELIRGLGIKASMNECEAAYTKDGERTVTGKRYRILFTTDVEVFRLPRKLERLPKKVRATQKRLYITDIRKVEATPMRCLRVDSVDKLYLTDGFIPTHNSILLQILMSGAILRDCDVFLIDPIKGGQDFDFAVPYVRAMVEQGDYLGAGELLQFIGAEAEERKKLNVQYKVGNYKDLPDDIRPRHMFVIIDEFQSLLKSQAKLPKEPESDDIFDIESWNQQKRINDGVGKVAKHIGKLAREARSVGITLVLAGQAMKATDLQAVGLGGLKSNFSRIAVGKMSYGDLASAFKEANTLPKLGAVVPPGRGLYESTAAPGIIIQNWWQPPVGDDANGQPEMGRQLARRVPAIPDERRVDINALTERVLNAAPKAFGEVLEDDDVIEDETTVELDAAELGLDDLDLSFDDLSFDDAPFTLEKADVPTGEANSESPLEDEPDDEPGMTFGLSGEVVIGRDVRFGVDVPMDVESDTWAEGDSFTLLLAANPGISTVVWLDEALNELDEIGIPRGLIAQDIAAKFGVRLVMSDEAPVSQGLEATPEQSSPEPADTPAPAQAAQASFELKDAAEDMFAPKKRDVDLGGLEF